MLTALKDRFVQQRAGVWQVVSFLPDRPDIVARASRRMSWDALLTILRRVGESALVQRLGYLLECNRVAVPPETLAALHGLVRPGSKIPLGPRARWGLHGPLSQAWNVIENVPREVLIEGDDPPKRRVTFPKRGGR